MSSPRSRPPLLLRAPLVIVAVAAMAFNVALMLSDRAPGLLRRIGGDFARRLFDRVDLGDRTATEVLEGSNLPAEDTIVHIVVWAVVVILVGLALWSWIGLAVGAIAVAAGSVLIEFAQGRYSTSRNVEARDIGANMVGVACGIAAVAVCYVLYSLIANMFRRRPYPGVE